MNPTDVAFGFHFADLQRFRGVEDGLLAGNDANSSVGSSGRGYADGAGEQDDLLRAIAAVGGYVEFGSQNADIHFACVYRERPFGIVRHFHVDFAFDVYFALLLFEYDGVDQP